MVIVFVDVVIDFSARTQQSYLCRFLLWFFTEVGGGLLISQGLQSSCKSEYLTQTNFFFLPS